MIDLREQDKKSSTLNMNQNELAIYEIEEFYCSRMEYLVDRERFDDADSIFNEFVVDGEEPTDYLFIKFIIQ